MRKLGTQIIKSSDALIYVPIIHLRTPANILKERPNGSLKKSISFTSLTFGETLVQKFGSFG